MVVRRNFFLTEETTEAEGHFTLTVGDRTPPELTHVTQTVSVHGVYTRVVQTLPVPASSRGWVGPTEYEPVTGVHCGWVGDTLHDSRVVCLPGWFRCLLSTVRALTDSSVPLCTRGPSTKTG